MSTLKQPFSVISAAFPVHTISAYVVGFGKFYRLVPQKLFFLELSSDSQRQVTDSTVKGYSTGCCNPQTCALSQTLLSLSLSKLLLHCKAAAALTCPFLLLQYNIMVQTGHLISVLTCKLWSLWRVLSGHLCLNQTQEKTLCQEGKKTYHHPRKVTICNGVQQCSMVKQPPSIQYTLVKLRACAFPEGRGKQ